MPDTIKARRILNQMRMDGLTCVERCPDYSGELDVRIECTGNVYDGETSYYIRLGRIPCDLWKNCPKWKEKEQK